MVCFSKTGLESSGISQTKFTIYFTKASKGGEKSEKAELNPMTCHDKNSILKCLVTMLNFT